MPVLRARSTYEARLFMDLNPGVACEGPEGFEAVEPGHPLYGGREPSELIDAGQWVWAAAKFAEMAARPGVDAPTGRLRLRAAMAAVLEVDKFGHPLTDAAFWTPLGRRMREEQPERFTEDAVFRAWETYNGDLSRFGVETPPDMYGPAAERRIARDRVERVWLARHGLGHPRDAGPAQSTELRHELRRLAGQDVATGFVTDTGRTAISAYNRVHGDLRAWFTGEPDERDRRLAAIADLRSAWCAREHFPEWDPDSIEEFDLPADRLPPAGPAWELVRAVRTAAGQDPETGEFVR
ncbi:hypothetical protein [Actinoplanes sp. HUAS TT8]|uniref:hypothetical protein n=1 Tax=Actinoplanes sp. HUAS TT8 TaxID=3447453 RepID=UPI003F520DF9